MCRAAEAVLAQADAALPGCDAPSLAAARLSIGHRRTLHRGNTEQVLRYPHSMLSHRTSSLLVHMSSREAACHGCRTVCRHAFFECPRSSLH